ncbi:hypothetical protein ACA758_03940 [Mycoplasmopsis agassizii]|uniref:hypothetical protein n=1 Tax=Mycoplasmopsis agassizii TaxID=33922 RepID=UPI003528818F
MAPILRRFYQTKDLDIAWYLVLGGLVFFFVKIFLAVAAYIKIRDTMERENPDLLKPEGWDTSDQENSETRDSEENPEDNNSETEVQDSKETDK